jgi:hypothetical protein
MACVRKDWAVGATVAVVVLIVVCGPVLGQERKAASRSSRDVKLVICPQKISAEAGKYVLLPPAASLADGDAVSWYDKAVKVLPGKAVGDQIQPWLKMPIEQLPADQVEKALTQYVESFKCVAQAIKCRQCTWPARTPGTQVANLEDYGKLGSAIRLWARSEIAQENYEGAVLALQTGLGMGRQLTQAPTLMQFLVGVGIASMMRAEAGEFVQAGEAPNLYPALAALPNPFTDVEKVIESDRKAASSEWSGKLSATRLESELKKSHDQVRIVAKRLDTDLTALQCVEAIRSYAASHGGQLPQALAEITEVSIPKDPMCGAAFRYSRTGATAVLESTTPAGGEKKDELRYELTVKN